MKVYEFIYYFTPYFVDINKTPVCGCRMYRGNVHVLKENAVVFSNGSVIAQVNIKNEYTCKHRKRVMSITYLCYMGSSVK